MSDGATWRRHELHATGNLCLAYYGWLRRYQAEGLEDLKDRSSRPHNSPRVTKGEVIEKILWLRKHYHFGPAKIAMYLARYHDVTVSTSGYSGS